MPTYNPIDPDCMFKKVLENVNKDYKIKFYIEI